MIQYNEFSPRFRLALSLGFMFLLICLGSGNAMAQPSGLDEDPGSAVPVDGGLSLLVGAGLLYGWKRVARRGDPEKVKSKAGAVNIRRGS